ncbi:hypothetical protein BRO54_0502 [Geobacillus proteiniphilus]|uniref:Uncharacterized protein n=1 Tax=Geobacillus proteiniphilus TaxID=860353 RepID=A0A1Q5T7Y3_9BACL|nr:hypothetical protein BRO54_0502 [Geobacillus proteiniphilus]
MIFKTGFYERNMNKKRWLAEEKIPFRCLVNFPGYGICLFH